jgi:hypothetical protein
LYKDITVYCQLARLVSLQILLRAMI